MTDTQGGQALRKALPTSGTGSNWIGRFLRALMTLAQVAVIHGGVSRWEQTKELAAGMGARRSALAVRVKRKLGAEIVIATPGRFIDVLSIGT